MMGTDAAGGAEFYLIARDPEGEYIATAEDIVRAKGNSGFTQSLRPVRTDRSEMEDRVLRELQDLLPESVRISFDNPLLTLRVTEPIDPLSAGICSCLCGTVGSCAGSGGGGG